MSLNVTITPGKIFSDDISALPITYTLHAGHGCLTAFADVEALETNLRGSAGCRPTKPSQSRPSKPIFHPSSKVADWRFYTPVPVTASGPDDCPF